MKDVGGMVKTRDGPHVPRTRTNLGTLKGATRLRTHRTGHLHAHDSILVSPLRLTTLAILYSIAVPYLRTG